MTTSAEGSPSSHAGVGWQGAKPTAVEALGFGAAGQLSCSGRTEEPMLGFVEAICLGLQPIVGRARFGLVEDWEWECSGEVVGDGSGDQRKVVADQEMAAVGFFVTAVGRVSHGQPAVADQRGLGDAGQADLG